VRASRGQTMSNKQRKAAKRARRRHPTPPSARAGNRVFPPLPELSAELWDGSLGQLGVSFPTPTLGRAVRPATGIRPAGAEVSRTGRAPRLDRAALRHGHPLPADAHVGRAVAPLRSRRSALERAAGRLRLRRRDDGARRAAAEPGRRHIRSGVPRARLRRWLRDPRPAGYRSVVGVAGGRRTGRSRSVGTRSTPLGVGPPPMERRSGPPSPP